MIERDVRQLRELQQSDEPAIRRRAFLLLGEAEPEGIGAAIRDCARVGTLLRERQGDGRLRPVQNVYKKWYAAHWVLVDLADLGYSASDGSLLPLRDQVYETWLAPSYWTTFAATSRAQAYGRHGLPVMDNRVRAHASQQGNALYATVKLGVADERAHELVRLLLSWRWPDGGWNCDKKPEADTSSFHETITPLRGLAAYVRWPGADIDLRQAAQEAVKDASELFLSRRLYRRLSNGRVIHPTFLQPAFPRYWHYDFLFGLIVMAEAGLLEDERCCDALSQLRAQQRPDGGWSALRKHYRVNLDATPAQRANASRVDWGPTGKSVSNPWVTLDALTVLKAVPD